MRESSHIGQVHTLLCPVLRVCMDEDRLKFGTLIRTALTMPVCTKIPRSWVWTPVSDPSWELDGDDWVLKEDRLKFGPWSWVWMPVSDPSWGLDGDDWVLKTGAADSQVHPMKN